MSQAPFQSAGEFVQLFGLTSDGHYKNFTRLIDRRVGFSVTRSYLTDLLFKPGMTKGGDPDSVALMHVVYTHPDESRRPFRPEKVPVVVTITTHSLFLSRNLDYNFSAPDCPTPESVQASRKSIRPLGLDSWDEFHFDHNTDTFYNDMGRQHTGVEILDSLFEKHCNTARRLKGLSVRTRIRSHAVVARGLGLAIDLIPKFLGVLFGRKLRKSPGSFVELSGYPKEALVLLSDDTLNLFGYKASKNVVVTFAGLVSVSALLYTGFGAGESLFLKRLFSNPLFPTCIGIFVLWLMDSPMPRFLFLLLNACIRLRKRLWFARHEI